MNNNVSPEEIIKEAMTVRDDGQEPKHPHECYDQTLLYVARQNQSPGESFPSALTRVVATDQDCDALIFAADRARAAASFTKSAPVQSVMKSSSIALDAERVAKSGSTPRYTRDDYHNEMVELSKSLARPNETPAVAFSRLVDEGHFDSLYEAGERADIVEIEAATKAAPQDDRFYPLLLDLARMRKRAGETIEAACARLMSEDPVVRDAYAASQGL